jgi:hypothetical protein
MSKDFEQQLARITQREAERASEFVFKSAHKPSVTKVKRRFRVACVCGYIVSGKFETEEQALVEYRQHTGVIEKQPRR